MRRGSRWERSERVAGQVRERFLVEVGHGVTRFAGVPADADLRERGRARYAALGTTRDHRLAFGPAYTARRGDRGPVEFDGNAGA